jgi:hypothetical protein
MNALRGPKGKPCGPQNCPETQELVAIFLLELSETRSFWLETVADVILISPGAHHGPEQKSDRFPQASPSFR